MTGRSLAGQGGRQAGREVADDVSENESNSSSGSPSQPLESSYYDEEAVEEEEGAEDDTDMDNVSVWLDDYHGPKGGKHPPSDAKTSLKLSIYQSKPDILGLWLGQDQKIYPSFSRLYHLFFGLPGLQENKEICLHKDAPSKPLLQYSIKDVNSSITIFSNLNSFQASIYLAIIPQPSRLLQQSIHLSYTIKVDGKQQDVPIHKIPHMLLGTTGSRSHPVYVFFPHMYRPKCLVHLSDTGALSGTSTQESILSTSQHIPATFQEAQLRSRATLEKTATAGGARGHPIGITITPYKDTHV
ncbi:hypothetical protein B0T25DRAFT_583096 [Lasiosphaeria hispida]|uniref:Uncharacterized protein n=1 Tax=Lasiosphaeria hispida TaxID=260671 RepID=A0AAJ0HA60_9PEZI|nr:hypothetical protein B0T25DRAFT_583096 [Lasiosphaeria hispida]